jgi:hypothetical protein
MDPVATRDASSDEIKEGEETMFVALEDVQSLNSDFDANSLLPRYISQPDGHEFSEII